jgi:hypothetical protein
MKSTKDRCRKKLATEPTLHDLETQGFEVTEPSYGPSPTKSRRRSKAAIQAIRDAIYQILTDYAPMTVRQMFYQLVTRGIIGKTEAEYKSTVCRLLVEMRRDGTIPYTWIADNTRWMRKPDTYSSLESMLNNCQQTYRRALWDNQDSYVEVWLSLRQD